MRFIMFAFLMIYTLHSYGQESKQDSITALKEVVVYDDAIQKNQAIGTVASSLIGTAVFQNYSPLDAVSAINQISGVYILSGALNTNRITIRGVGARTLYGTDKLRLYYNDIPITNGTGSSSIEAYDLENLNAVAVIKGPKGTAFGANLGGAILLTAKQHQAARTLFSNSFTAGSYKLVKNNLTFSHTQENFTLGVTYGHTEIDGYRENSNFKRDGFLLNSTYTIDAKNQVSLLVNYIDYTAQIPSSISKSNFDADPQKAAFTWKEAQGYEANKYSLLGVSYSHQFTENLKNTTSIFYTYLDHYEPRPFNILDEFTNGYGFRTRFMGSFGFLKHRGDYTIGTELYQDEYNWKTFENLYEDNNGNGSLQGNKISDNKEYRSQSNTFGTLTLPFSDDFTTQFGLAVNKTKYNYSDLYNTGDTNKNARKSFAAIVLPSLNLNYNFSEKYSIYGNISRGFSNPNIEETLTPDGVINPDIAQETGMNYEVGSLLLFDANKLKIDVALYQMNIKNLLVAQRIGDDEFIGKNAGSTRHKGVELEVSYQLAVTKKIMAIPFFGYTYNHHRFEEFLDAATNYSGNWLTGVPKNKLNSGVQVKHTNGLFWNTTHQYVGEIPMNDANTLYSDSFSIISSKIGFVKHFDANFSVSVNAGVQNIFNAKYAQSVLINAVGFGSAEPRYYYPGNNRNYYGGLQLRYVL